jgi:D-glycero-alpha-D-manno-heptose 1-phosphate guanylyltransferase
MLKSKDVHVLILAGGRGTRLGSLTESTPKPMLPVGEKPLIYILLSALYKQGFEVFTICTHYHHQIFERDLLPRFPDLQFIVEPNPLGTGGAILNALPLIERDIVLVLNGDSVLDIDYAAFAKEGHRALQDTSVLIAGNFVEHQTRFGFIDHDAGGNVLGFREKPSLPMDGVINSGLYLLNRKKFLNLQLPPGPCSFETDVLPELIQNSQVQVRSYNDPFIDIGISEDYERADEVLGKMKHFREHI